MRRACSSGPRFRKSVGATLHPPLHDEDPDQPPPGKARFTIVDPVGLGQSLSSFMHLADADERLVSSRIWTDQRHIEQALVDLTDHLENVIQKYLRNDYDTIAQYNEAAGEIAEPYRFLVLQDFPTNLSEIAAKRLASLLTSGPRCGIFTLIHQDRRHALLAALMKQFWNEERGFWNSGATIPSRRT